MTENVELSSQQIFSLHVLVVGEAAKWMPPVSGGDKIFIELEHKLALLLIKLRGANMDCNLDI